jgi:type IV pilus assembly protein PilQ
MKRTKEKLEDLTTEMIHLKYAIAQDMVPVVKNFLSERGTVSADERTNILIIRDTSKNIEEIRDLFRSSISERGKMSKTDGGNP